MPKKLQSFFIFKLASSRLKRSNFKINLSLDEARENGEVVRLSDCQLLRSIRNINNKKVNVEKLEKSLKKYRNEKYNKNKVFAIRKEIDEQLFVPEIAVIIFDNISHYEKMLNRGLFINDLEYVRLLSSAGHARKKEIFVIRKDLYDQIDYILDCGRDEEYKINPSKYNAYYALCTSGGLEIEIPRFTVIPDYEVSRIVPVEYVIDTNIELEEPSVEFKEIEQVFNLFDGQGLMSRTFANIIADKYELDYTPSALIFRMAFGKGMLCTFDFKEFAEENGLFKITDIYGNQVDVKDVDVILSASQFKMFGAYKNLDQYVSECKKRNYNWTIGRVTPKVDKNIFYSNYQYLQVLDLEKEDVEKMCQPTVDYLQNVSGLDWMSSVLFLMGDIEEKNISKSWFDSLDITLKQLLYKPESIQDKYIQAKLRRMLEKKIKESCLGKLIFDGNYSVMISDPYAQAQWAFGLQPTGLLKSKEFYSKYWNKKNVSRIAGMRSPLTWKSEVNLMQLKKTEETEKWFSYLSSGTILNIYDESTMLFAGSDFDFDIVATTNNEFVLKGASGGLPVTYDRKSASKQKIDKNRLWISDIQTFDNKIGFLTNLATTFFSLLSKYEKGSEEYCILENRLKTCCAYQSMQIDKGKGILTGDIPKHWSNWNKWKDDDSEEIIELKKKYNQLLAEQRPYFMRYLYPQKDKAYREHEENYNLYSLNHFGMSIKDLVKNGSDGNEEKQKAIDFYLRYSPLFDTDSLMNQVAHFMENKVKIKRQELDMSFDFDVGQKKLEKMQELYRNWNKEKHFAKEDGEEDVSLLFRKKADDISINTREIAKLALMTNTRFATTVFGEDILELFKKQVVSIPILDNVRGDKYFNGNKYRIVNFDLEAEISV